MHFILIAIVAIGAAGGQADPPLLTTSATSRTGHPSLGRPTSMVRPAINGAPSGVLMTYDGLTARSDEVAGGEGGPVARKVLVNDAYGRLAEVREYTSFVGAGTRASTHYQYDAHDRVSRIESPDSVVTVLTHDYLAIAVPHATASKTPAAAAVRRSRKGET